jgi:hypothetical protein
MLGPKWFGMIRFLSVSELEDESGLDELGS